jgi:hypothetical protein
MRGAGLFRRQTPEANTTRLIGSWTMDGAGGDLGERFRSPLDLGAVVSERSHEATTETAPYTPPPLLMKPADEEGWRPLLVGVPDRA